MKLNPFKAKTENERDINSKTLRREIKEEKPSFGIMSKNPFVSSQETGKIVCDVIKRFCN